MEKIIRSTRKRFIAVIVIVVAIVVASSWGILAVFAEREIAAPAHIQDVHKNSQDNPALAGYIEEQKAFAAHFVALTNEVRQDDATRVTRALALTSIIVITIGTIVAIVAARRLMKPVVEAYESQERFLQDAAHELRNPLAAMTIALQQADPKKSDAQLLTTMKRQTKRLIAINEDLLFLERRSTTPATLLDLQTLLADVVEELQPLAIRKKVSIRLDAANSIQKRMVAGDYIRLTKNIIDNAIKYTKPKTTVTITQSIHKGTIVLVVSDQGIGIPKKDVAHVGERFFRASNTGAIDGTGLGLAIVKKILNKYSGSINFTSSKSGTTVTVKLPA